MGQTRGTVREWHAELGWGVLDSPDTTGGCWAHFSNIDGTGFRALTVGATVDLDWERAEQDGYSFRATRVKRLEP
ncbi:cold shock domain-containing protein [Rhodococcus spelaei]|uniref:cold shock domain-containing protein n=1 Tax=Rhodococcus spelaei TaxID=2546320 RepID=UPI001C672E88|nr:cold shock domain-containing protein [Rhodococcus spelaei]